MIADDLRDRHDHTWGTSVADVAIMAFFAFRSGIVSRRKDFALAVIAGVLLVDANALAEPMEGMSADDGMQAGPLGIGETRDASGTSWQPDSTPMFMWRMRADGWRLALHENAFVGYDDKATQRGEEQFTSMNWLMGMATHELGGGELTFRAMLSAEPATVQDGGYPLLLQTGETYRGQPLHDRQHPHDLFMEVAARYRRAVSDTFGIELYGGPAGEPAIGPVAFPHRFTALADPLAPLGHHWLDATHISYGVVTAGIFTHDIKLEGSWFNGREPDEDRWNFDLRGFDSAAVRLSVNPTPDVSAQVSWAYLASPEQLEPDVSQQRTTASVTWNDRLADGKSDLAVSAEVGRDNPSMGPATNASLAEAALVLRDTHTVFARAELLEKSGQDLVLPAAMADQKFGMGSFSAGYIYDLHDLGPIVPGIGGVVTVDAIGSALEPAYGTRAPWGGMVFVRLRPPMMPMGGMHHAM